MTVYNKLVRDKIPAIIEAAGEKSNIRILDDKEYRHCLEIKLDEEVAEFHKEKNLEELVDILEVVYALTETLGHSRTELNALQKQKWEKRGGFRERFFLVSKERLPG